MDERDEPKKEDDEEIQDLDLDQSEEGEEITERVRGGRRPFSG